MPLYFNPDNLSKLEDAPSLLDWAKLHLYDPIVSNQDKIMLETIDTYLNLKDEYIDCFTYQDECDHIFTNAPYILPNELLYKITTYLF